MKREKYEDFLEQLEYSKNKWYILNDIDAIYLDNGVGIYPNWCHTRFMFRDNDILIRHGYSIPYGARLISMYAVSSDRYNINFPPGNIISSTEFYRTFRPPKAGDILVSSDGLGNNLSESLVRQVLVSSNTVSIYLSNQVSINQNSRLSFYDPIEYKKEECSHSESVEGVYMKFNPNNGGKKDKNAGNYHEVIKIKNITEISLKLNTKKVYNIRG